jgi:hypothetical protein
LRGFVQGLAVEAAEDDGDPVRLGKALHFLVQDRQQLTGAEQAQWVGTGIGRRFRIGRQGGGAAAADRRPHLQRGTMGGAIQPGGECPGTADAARMPRQRQEGRLKGVLGRVELADNALAHTQDHRSVPPDERGEGLFVTKPNVLCQQLGV